MRSCGRRHMPKDTVSSLSGSSLSGGYPYFAPREFGEVDQGTSERIEVQWTAAGLRRTEVQVPSVLGVAQHETAPTVAVEVENLHGDLARRLRCQERVGVTGAGVLGEGQHGIAGSGPLNHSAACVVAVPPKRAGALHLEPA